MTKNINPIILDSSKYKRIVAPDFNHFFNKETGLAMTWGKTQDDDPEFCPYGPLLADIEVGEICHMGCSFCVHPSTLVETDDGFKKIEDMKVGEQVRGVVPTGMVGFHQVVETHRKYVCQDIIVVDLPDGSVLKLTADHKVYVSDRGWVEAGDLKEGDDLIMESDGKAMRNMSKDISNKQGESLL